jgi:hypothetical protein
MNGSKSKKIETSGALPRAINVKRLVLQYGTGLAY